MIALIFIILLLLFVLAGGYYFARIMVYPRVHDSQYTYDHELSEGKIKEPDFTDLPKREIRLQSPFGYELFGIYIPFGGSNKTVVLVHGITWSLFGMVKYMWMFRRRGFNLLLYDHRNHGRSGGNNTTFGFYEKHDLKGVVDWAFAQLPQGGTVGTMGESLGAATALQEASLDPRLAFVVADCPFSDFEALVKYRKAHDYPYLPDFPLLQIARWFTHRMTGFRPADARPIEGIPQIQTPILFCHGQMDGYIPPQMSINMHQAKIQGISRLYLAPNAKHAQSFWTNPEEYDQVVGEFLDEVFG